MIWIAKDFVLDAFEKNFQFDCRRKTEYGFSRVTSNSEVYKNFCLFVMRNYARIDHLARCYECDNCTHYHLTQKICLNNPANLVELWNDAVNKTCRNWPDKPDSMIDPGIAWQALEMANGDLQAAYSRYIQIKFKITGNMVPGFNNKELQEFYKEN